MTRKIIKYENLAKLNIVLQKEERRLALKFKAVYFTKFWRQIREDKLSRTCKLKNGTNFRHVFYDFKIFEMKK